MIPLWLKLAVTVLVAAIVVVYWLRYGSANFLWFSDIALIGTVPALWLESALIASALAVAVLLPELLWNASYFVRLLTGRRIHGLTDYMFDRARPRWLRALSLFHVPLPLLLLWLLHVLGYDPRGVWLQTLIAWVVLPVTYRFTDPEENINCVFGPGADPQRRIAPPLYLAIVMLAFPLLIYLPTHWLLLVLAG